MSDYKSIEELKGKTLTKVEASREEVIFETAEGPRYRLYHSQDCCESVTVREIDGSLSVLVGEVLIAREEQGHEWPGYKKWDHESVTLTDFVIQTTLGRVTFKWIGESNGYYSESVEFIQLS